MGVVNNEIRIAGIEANTAGIMTSVASFAEALNTTMTSVNSLKTTVGNNTSGLVKDVEDLKIEGDAVVLLSTDTTLSTSVPTTLSLTDSISKYKEVVIHGYSGSNSGGNRFSFNVNITMLKKIAGAINSETLAFINDNDMYVAMIELATVDEQLVLKITIRKLNNTIATGMHVNEVIGYLE